MTSIASRRTRPALLSCSDQQPGGDQQAEGAEQGPGAGERAVQRRPVGARRARRGRRDRQRQREQAEQRPPGPAVAEQQRDRQRRRRRRRRARRRGDALRSRPSRTASVLLPARRSVSMSRTLLTTRIAVARQPTATERPSGSQSSSLELDVVGAVDGDQAEEEEDEELAEARVAVGPGPARVEDAGGDRERRRSARITQPATVGEVDARRRPPPRTRPRSRPGPAAGRPARPR